MIARKKMWIAVGFLVVLPVLGLTLLSLAAPLPFNLGEHDGRLAECPDSPNCVCSQSENPAHRVEPIPFDGSVEEARDRLKEILGQMPRTTIVSESDRYLRAECRSRLFRFVDDLEFVIDDRSKPIHIRSASRAGYSDLGVNRQRVETIRKLWQRR